MKTRNILESYFSVVAAFREPAWLLDADASAVVHANPSAAILSKTPWEAGPANNNWWWYGSRKKSSFDGRVTLQDAAGVSALHSLRTSPLWDGATIFAWLCIAKPLVGHSENQEKLQQSAPNQEFREIVENLPELAWSAQADGHIDYYNERWYAYTGTTFEQMEGWGWRSVHHPDMFEKVLPQWQASIQSGEAFEMEFPLRRSDGAYRWFLTRVRPLRGATGEINRWFGTNTDIEDQRQARLQYEQLLLREQAAVRHRDEFLAVASHELRTPVTSATLHLQMVQRAAKQRGGIANVEAARLNKMLVVIDHQLKTLRGLIDDLLDVSRVANGRLTINAYPVDLTALCRQVIEQNEGLMQQAGCRYSFAAPGPLYVRCDAKRIEQVINNLVSNACKYAAEKPIEISLGQVGDIVRLTVADHGRGMDEEAVGRVFERFERAVNFRSISGLGLGLFISREIVQAHDGSISLISQPGVGSIFTVDLPLLGV